MADTTIYRLALIGFGSAGQGLAQILRDHGDCAGATLWRRAADRGRLHP